MGFGSLAISDFAVIRQFGLLTALGLLLALVVTLTLLPALAAFGAGAPRPKAARKGVAFMTGLAGRVSRGPGVVLATGMLAVVIVGSGMVLIVKSVDWTLCLKRGSSPHHAEMLIREKLNGSLPMQLLVRGDLLDPATLLTMRRLERRLDAQPSLGRSQSIAGVIAEMNAAMNGSYAIPMTREGVANLWFLVEEEDEIEQLVAKGTTGEGLVHARVADWETDAIIEAVEGVDGWLGTRSDRLVVLDPRTLTGAPASVVREQQLADLVTQIRGELAGRGLEATEALAAPAAAFAEWMPDAEARAQAGEAVRAYLASPEAEVTLTAQEADRLADAVTPVVGLWGVDPATATETLRTVRPDVDGADTEALGLSLERVTFEAVGRRRVEDTMTSLTLALPALANDSVLRRDVRGVLWEAHGPLTVLDGAVTDRWGVDEGAVVREVRASIGRSGLASVMKQMEEELLPTQIQSVLLTLIVVLALLSIMFRAPAAGVLMITPLLATIAVSFGAMGYLSIGLDSFTAMVASVAIGLGVDYAIHFTHRFRRELARAGGEDREALAKTMTTSGIAILVNALSVGLGFLVLLAAGGQHIRRFGGLTALAMLSAGLFTLLLLPALYLKVRPRFLRDPAKDRERQRPAASILAPVSGAHRSG